VLVVTRLAFLLQSQDASYPVEKKILKGEIDAH